MASEDELVKLQQVLYESSNPTRRWLHCTRRDWIIEALRKYAPATRIRALEVGPGSGIYLPVLADLFEQVYATDIEAAYLKNAESFRIRHPNINLMPDDITASQLPPHSFDLILCSEVIEHIENSQAAIAGMRRLLKPDGVLILSTPQRYSPLELMGRIAFLPGVIQVVRMIYREPILETGHINLMTSRQVMDQLQEQGFRVSVSNKSGMYIPLIAEFLGKAGLKLEQSLERLLRGGPADGLLWVQYYVAHIERHQ